jgi:carbon storage regulator
MMLVLTRRIGQGIEIAGEIRVKVVDVRGNKVRLGITAPASVGVARLELLVDHSNDADAESAGCTVLRA